MNFNIFNSLILAGVIQGFIFGGLVLFSKKHKSNSTLYLALLILCFSFNVLQYYFSDTKILTDQQFYAYLYINWALIIPPLLFFYVSSLLKPENKISLRKKIIGYTPFFVILFFATLYKILVAIDYQNKQVYNFFYILSTLAEFFAIFYMISVLINLLFKIYRYEKQHEDFKLNFITIQLTWLKTILFALMILSFIWSYLMYLVVIGQEISFYPLWIGISILIYWLGHVGIYKYGITVERKKIRNYSIENKSLYAVEKQKNEHIAALENLIIVQKKYLDSNLTLEKIAEEMQLSKSHLSKIINSELGIGFVDYVNTLRVEEAKNYLINPEFSKYTLESIGLEAGFNSKSAFYAAFKKTSGLTPTEFKKNNSNLS